MAGFTPKQVLVNGKGVLIVQNSLMITGGYGETTVRTQVFGKSTVQVLSQNLENAKSKITFDIITTDSTGSDDPRQLIKIWKQQGNANLITVVPDGEGKNQQFPNMALTNDPEVKETPDGVISLVWEGKPIQLT